MKVAPGVLEIAEKMTENEALKQLFVVAQTASNESLKAATDFLFKKAQTAKSNNQLFDNGDAEIEDDMTIVFSLYNNEI